MEMCDFLYLLIESHYSHVESSLRMRDVCAQKCVYHLDEGKGVTAGRETWEFQMDFSFSMQFLCLISRKHFWFCHKNKGKSCAAML